MKVALLVPYFGDFPSIFDFFIESVKRNPDFDWIFFTDNKLNLGVINNVKVIDMSFDDFKSLAKKSIGEDIVIDRPHKICDYRPAFGVIFENWLKEYDFWGHCDVDVIYGDLKKFIKPNILESHDRIFLPGHFSLFRNSSQVNNLYKEELNGDKLYKKIFSSDNGFAFDEAHCKGGGIIQLFLKKELKIFREDYCLNLDSTTKVFKTTSLNLETLTYSKEDNSNQIYSFNKGVLMKHQVVGNEIINTEHTYVHFHKRSMQLCCDSNSTSFLIVPNKIIPYKNFTIEDIVKYSKESGINFQYLKVKYGNLKYRIKQIFK